MQRNKDSEFMRLRASGVPASQISDGIVEPMIQMISTAPDEALFSIGEVFDYEWEEPEHTFESVVCDQCGEMVVKRNTREKDGRTVCMPCFGE